MCSVVVTAALGSSVRPCILLLLFEVSKTRLVCVTESESGVGHAVMSSVAIKVTWQCGELECECFKY